MAGEDDDTGAQPNNDNPPNNNNRPRQPKTHTLSSVKLPILKKGEYDNGNGPMKIATDTAGNIRVLPPVSAEEIYAREKERRARTTLLMALPEDHLAKFHSMTDAKEI
ncbi:hypothetical protein Tco_0043180 [Tanacetum coccineum]